MLGALAFTLVVAALALWFRFLSAVTLGGRRGPLYALVVAGLAAGLVALASGPGLLGGALAALAVLGGLVWIGLGLVAGQSRQTPAVAVGEPLPAFHALDEHGARFELADLRGHPVLIKLFRGHW